jgi:hypothetical protein
MSASNRAPRQRLVTTLNDKAHWVTLSPPSDDDGNRQILLTTDENDAAIVTFKAVPTVDTPDALLVTFPEFSSEETLCLMRPRITPTSLPTELGTKPFGVADGKSCPLSWVKVPKKAEEDPEEYTVHLAEEPTQKVLISHEAGFNLTRPPYLFLSPSVSEAAAAVFVTQTVCSACGFIWTENADHVCGFCHAYDADQKHIAAHHGAPPMRPCDCCGEPTPYGGYCSQACRWDAEGDCDYRHY